MESFYRLDSCPQCGVNRPTLAKVHGVRTHDHQGTNQRDWGFFVCANCGGILMVERGEYELDILYPEAMKISEVLPERAKHFLGEATKTFHAPSASLVMSSSAVDAMLKELGYKDGSLYSRINSAKEKHLITDGMAKWAHEVRLEANDQRHADENAPLPTEKDAKNVFRFAEALGDFLFVLPNRVSQGIKAARSEETPGQ